MRAVGEDAWTNLSAKYMLHAAQPKTSAEVKGCQSNCILDPQPPTGTASSDIVKHRVIGYYEAWMARKNCHKVTPMDLPLDALTHLNFAFASIDPETYDVVTMDSATPAKLFKDATNVKSVKEDLLVYVSMGGWSFSDNDTATQPLFGKISADKAKRQTFANNIVHFMRQYGFDGVDLDWEYPGAGDRGGKPEDTDNYVLLLKTLRETFDASGNTYGLTFTAPSSYWYLRGFDLPNMAKYADWINVMTYDLHGVWDANNPIGSIVQGHTNLTEIKSALQLFWRAEISPAQLVLGFGFYGRSFTLADPACNKPGCPFSGAAKAESCSGTGGMLAHYEILSILQGGKKRDKLKVTHDKDAAVNYLTFDDDQWVSYDDVVTFKQKVDRANSVGLGGSLVWASDLDDDKYSAHTGLLGRDIIKTDVLQAMDTALSSPQSTVNDLATFNGQKCFAYKGDCVNLNDNDAMSKACGSGYTVVGWDGAGCGKKSCHCGKPICCPSKSAPKSCKWRGDSTGKSGISSDCNGQCEAGEMNINGIRSSWGGGFVNDGDTDKCGRGYKVFCCQDPDYQEVTNGCKYAECRKDCPVETSEVMIKRDNCWVGGQKYCCPTKDLTSCHWVDLATYGDTYHSCDWGRKKAACCSVQIAPTRKATCSTNLCSLMDEFCGPDNDGDFGTFAKRGLDNSGRQTYHGTQELIIFDGQGGDAGANGLEQRAIEKIKVKGLVIVVINAPWPSISSLYTIARASLVLRKAFRAIPGYCASNLLSVTRLSDNPTKKELEQLETEHPIDKDILDKFVKDMANNRLRSGKPTPNIKLAMRPRVGGSKGRSPARPNERLAEAFGSTINPSPFLAVQKSINLAKSKIMMPLVLAVDRLFSTVQVAFTTFDYLRHPDFEDRWEDVMEKMDDCTEEIQQDAAGVGLMRGWQYGVTIISTMLRGQPGDGLMKL
ncbi:hypothetical protein BDW72DRAFT_194648 [Aspergillus terricola var. indicus]